MFTIKMDIVGEEIEKQLALFEETDTSKAKRSKIISSYNVLRGQNGRRKRISN